MTLALDWSTEGSNGFLFICLFIFIEIYNNRINIYLNIFLEKTYHLNVQIFFYMYDDEDSSSIARILSVNIQSGWNGSENQGMWRAVEGIKKQKS